MVDVDGKKMMSLFAGRAFAKNEVIGLYVGEVVPVQGAEESVYLLNYTRRLNVDVKKRGKERLNYGMDMHMMNDLHHGQEVSEKENRTF